MPIATKILMLLKNIAFKDGMEFAKLPKSFFPSSDLSSLEVERLASRLSPEQLKGLVKEMVVKEDNCALSFIADGIGENSKLSPGKTEALRAYIQEKQEAIFRLSFARESQSAELKGTAAEEKLKAIVEHILIPLKNELVSDFKFLDHLF